MLASSVNQEGLNVGTEATAKKRKKGRSHLGLRTFAESGVFWVGAITTGGAFVGKLEDFLADPLYCRWLALAGCILCIAYFVLTLYATKKVYPRIQDATGKRKPRLVRKYSGGHRVFAGTIAAMSFLTAIYIHCTSPEDVHALADISFRNSLHIPQEAVLKDGSRVPVVLMGKPPQGDGGIPLVFDILKRHRLRWLDVLSAWVTVKHYAPVPTIESLEGGEQFMEMQNLKTYSVVVDKATREYRPAPKERTVDFGIDKDRPYPFAFNVDAKTPGLYTLEFGVTVKNRQRKTMTFSADYNRFIFLPREQASRINGFSRPTVDDGIPQVPPIAGPAPQAIPDIGPPPPQ